MKKKVTLLTIFVLLFSSLGMLNAQPARRRARGAAAQAWRSVLEAEAKPYPISPPQSLVKSMAEKKPVEEEEKPLLGRLFTEVAHKDVRPLIIGYVATAPTFIGAAKEIVPLAQTNKALREESINALANRIEREAVAKKKDVKRYTTDLLFEVIISRKPVPLIAFEALKRAGADLNELNQYDMTPLMWAVRHAPKKTVDTLINAGANVNAQGRDGSTPLLVATSMGHTPIVDALIKANADVNAQRQNGDTPLIEAVKNGYAEIVEALINAGANVNAQDSHGNTPLLFSAIRGYRRDITQKLLDAGADKTIKNKMGQTARDVATDTPMKKLLE